MPNSVEIGPPQLSLLALFGRFLRFGALAFGGPVAQIAMIRQALVEDECWIDRGRFNRLLAVLQVLPGPEAHELCVHLGVIARGRIGGLLAGLGFMLPGLLLMLGAGWLYRGWIAGHAGFAGVLLAVQVVVLAIIARAAVRIGQHIVEDRALAVIAVASLAATLAGVPFWIPLAAGGLAYALSHRPVMLILVVAVAVAAAAGAHLAGSFWSGQPTGAVMPVTLAGLFLAGLKGGLLTFGGAYTAIPFVRADTVGRGWIGDDTFLDGVALAGVLPAPLVIFATFIGYVAGDLAGALAITAGIFLPAFAFSLLFFERLESLTEHPALQRVLTGVAAAVVGIIAGTLVVLALATFSRVSQPLVAALLFIAGATVAWRVKGAWVTPALVAAAGAFGYAVAL